MTSTTLTPDMEKQRAAQNSLFCAIGLTVLKLAAGVTSNSLGILSEALHSSLDLLAAAITLFAVKMASRPADKKYPYGYGKIENLSALAETLLLLVTCGWIVHEAVDRLFFESQAVYPSWWGVSVIVIAMLVDISRAKMLHKIAKKHKSQALEADALHFSTDIWSSAVVLVGLACVWVSTVLPPEWSELIRCLCMGDAAAALVVSAIVIFMGLKLSNKAVNALLDGDGLAQTEKLEKELAEHFPGCAIHRLRVRESGAKIFVDLTAETPAILPVESAHELSDNIEAVICESVPGADVTVHIEPAKNSGIGILATTQAIAAAYALAIHNVTLSRQKDDGSLLIFLHVETPPEMTLDEAHQRVARFEGELRERLAANVLTHIEPSEQNIGVCSKLPPGEAQRLRETVKNVLKVFPTIFGVHNFRFYHLGDGPLLSLHCRMPASLTVADAHTLASLLERELLAQAPSLRRILIHTDPEHSAVAGDPHR